MELIDRYVYAVTRRLPADQRADIERELRGLIEDMLAKETKEGLPTDKAAETVLKNLGYPALLAARYRGTEQHLIGPDIFHLYTIVLKIVLLATAGGLLIAMVVSFLTGRFSNPVQTVLETIGSLISGVIGAFGGVTLIFAAIERYSPEKVRAEAAESFDPHDLPDVPQKKDRIHPADPIASMVFALIAMIVALYVPRFVGLYWIDMPEGGMIPLFNESVYRAYLPFILVVLVIGVIREIGKLVAGRWTISLSVFYLALGLPGLILTILFFRDPNLFNPAFFEEIHALSNTQDPMLLGMALPQFISRLIIGLSIFGFVVEAVTTLARIVRQAIRT